MNILLISNNTFSNYGGYEKVVYTVINRLSNKYNFDFVILSLPHYNSTLVKRIVSPYKISLQTFASIRIKQT